MKIKTDNLIINLDKQAAIYNYKNETIKPKYKHFDLWYHKIKELVKSKINFKICKITIEFSRCFYQIFKWTIHEKIQN